jgi:outer membrane protein assembly factor BamB
LNKQVVAVDAASGRDLWRFDAAGWVWGTPTLVEGILYAGDLEGTVYALDASSGSELWSVDTEGAITGSPLVVEDAVYVVNENGDVVAITTEGSVRWTRNLDRPLYGSLVAAGELLLVGQTNASAIVTALDHNGDTVWSFAPEN